MNDAAKPGESLPGDMPPIVSVVIATYNRADLLPRSVESVISQDENRFELVVVDDGSTDSTVDLVAAWNGAIERLRYIRLEENGGIGNARQIGLNAAEGKFVALLDSDDLWLPGKLKLQIEVMEKYPQIDILFGDWRNIHHDTGRSTRGFEWTHAGMRHLDVHPLEAHLYRVDRGLEIGILRDNFIATSTIMMRAGIFERTGGYNPALVTGADHEFLWRAAALGAGFAYIDRPLAERHIYPSSVTADGLEASKRILIALSECRRTCTSANRSDLLKHVRAAELRAYRRIMRRYGERARPLDVFRTYIDSLRIGPSLSNLGFLFLCLAGPGIMKAFFTRRESARSAFKGAGSQSDG